MKALGSVILIIGLLLGAYALKIDVGVDVPSKSYGYGITTPAMRVANADLMAQRQNYLIFSGILSIVGAILLGFGSMAQPTPVPVSGAANRRKDQSAPAQNAQKAAAEQRPASISICPKCRHMGPGDAESCDRCGASLEA